MSMCPVCWFDGRRLTDEQERLCADALRYRWLRDHALEVALAGPVVCDADKWGELRTQSNGRHITRDGHNLDAEIDAAMLEYQNREHGRAK